MRRLILIIAAATLLLLRGGSDPAPAQTATPAFASKTVQLVIGFPGGSAYDLIARTVGRHLGAHIPGNPSVIPQNMPGAGSLEAANYLYNIAPKDGTALGIVSQDAITASLINPTGIYFDAPKFAWLGSATTETLLAVAALSAKADSLQDLYTTQFVVGEAGAGGGANLVPKVLNALLGMKFKTVGGYPALPDLFLAMERGEVEGMFTSYASLMLLRPDWVPQKKVKMLFQAGADPNPALKDVPFLPSLAKTEDQRAALRLLFTGQGIGKAFFAPPNLKDGALQMLRDAFDATMADPEFIADMNQQKIAMNPTRGADLEARIKNVYATPRTVIEQLSSLMKQ